MPMLDPSAVLTDPRFAQPLTIKRRTETVGSNGRLTIGYQIVTPAPVGVVEIEDGGQLQNDEGARYAEQVIKVYTNFRMRGPAPGYQPDQVIWNGTLFVVRSVANWAAYGAGFVVATCGSVDSLDQPPE